MASQEGEREREEGEVGEKGNETGGREREAQATQAYLDNLTDLLKEPDFREQISVCVCVCVCVCVHNSFSLFIYTHTPTHFMSLLKHEYIDFFQSLSIPLPGVWGLGFRV